MAGPQMKSYGAYDFFVYEVDFAALTAGSSQTSSFTIQQEADFLLTKINMSPNIAAAAYVQSNTPVPLVTIMINDTGSGRNLMSSAVPLPNLFGNAGLPFILPRQRLFVASSVVNITLTNYDAAVSYNIRLSFIGEKAFQYGAA